jgi:hypothetical protein
MSMAGRSLKDSVERSVLRLLRALERSGGKAEVRVDGSVAATVRAGHVERTVVLPAGPAAAASSDGLVRLTDREVELLEAGRARLARTRNKAAPFLAQHRPLSVSRIGEGREAALLWVDQGESPLAWLRSRRGRDGASLIPDHAFLAGERLRADFTNGSLMPRVTATWQAVAASCRRGAAPGLDYSDRVLAARARVGRALDAVGPELAGVLVDICCFLKGLEEVESERGWPARSAKIVLCLGLERLARHYGLSAEARGAARPGAIRAWSDGEARSEQ